MFYGVVSEPLPVAAAAAAAARCRSLLGAGDAGAHRVVAAVISAHLARRSAWYQPARPMRPGVIAYASIKSDSPRRRQHPHDNFARSSSPSFLSPFPHLAIYLCFSLSVWSLYSLSSRLNTLPLVSFRAGSRDGIKTQIYEGSVAGVIPAIPRAAWQL